MERVKELDYKISSLKQEWKKVKQEQLEYYNKLLQDGIETRRDGFIWIIKAIWYLGFEVNPTKYPRYLDNEGIKYLVNMARISLKHDHILRQFKSKLFLGKTRRIRKLTTKKNYVWGGVAIGILRKLIRTRTINLDKGYNTFKVPRKLLKSDAIECKYGSNEKNSEIMNIAFDKLPQELEEVNEQIKELKRVEACRLSKLFKTKPYENKFELRRKISIGLLGEDGSHLERFTNRGEKSLSILLALADSQLKKNK